MSGYQASFRNSIVRPYFIPSCETKSDIDVTERTSGIPVAEYPISTLRETSFVSGNIPVYPLFLAAMTSADFTDFFPTLENMLSSRCCTTPTQSQRSTLRLGSQRTLHLSCKLLFKLGLISGNGRKHLTDSPNCILCATIKVCLC